MSRAALRAALLMTTVASAVASSSARAQPEAEGRDLFLRGRDLRVHGDCAGAIVVFRKASEVYPEGLGSLRNIAECQEQLGQYASARRTWLDLKRALANSPSPRYDGWVPDADGAEARLAPKVGTLVVALSVVGPHGEPEPADGIHVTINDEPIAPSLMTIPLDRDPGRYVVRAVRSDGVSLQEQVVDLTAGNPKQVAFRVMLAPSLATADMPSGSTVRTAGWIAIGGGAASLVGAGVSLVVYQSAHDRLQSRCPNYQTQPCDPSVRSTVDEGRTASTVFNVLGIVGLAAVAGGSTALLLGPQGARTAVGLSPTGLWASGEF